MKFQLRGLEIKIIKKVRVKGWGYQWIRHRRGSGRRW